MSMMIKQGRCNSFVCVMALIVVSGCECALFLVAGRLCMFLSI